MNIILCISRAFWDRPAILPLIFAHILEKKKNLLNRMWVCSPSVQQSQPTETKERKREVSQSCPTLHDLMNCSWPGSSIHGIFQTRILGWVAISFSRGACWSRDRTQFSSAAGRLFTIWATREAHTFICIKQGERAASAQKTWTPQWLSGKGFFKATLLQLVDSALIGWW